VLQEALTKNVTEIKEKAAEMRRSGHGPGTNVKPVATEAGQKPAPARKPPVKKP
jgi:hypothetical protein